jgi:Contractile injection system tube protein
MPASPITPKLLKGALISLNLPDPTPAVITFQYNPETLTRSLEAQTAGGEGADRSEALRLKGAPVETIKLDVELDATDQLELGDPTATSSGIYPQLSALEMLIYPASAVVIANTILLALGTIEVLPPSGPFTLFVWGPKRVLPVRVQEFSITEEAYDTNLNPIRAKVSLGLRVLSYNDLPVTNPGYHLFLAHQVIKETLAKIGTVNSLGAVLKGDLKLI